MLAGLDVTLEVSLLSIILGTLTGALLCFMRMSRNRVVRSTAKFYVELMHCLPLLLLLLVLFYLVFASSSLGKIQVAIVCFSLYFGAFFARYSVPA